MKRLLMIATVPPTLWGFLAPFAEHFRSLGWRVDGMANQINQSQACREVFDQVWDVAWSRNPLDAKNILQGSKTVRDIVASNQYDLVHVHTPVAAFVCRFALRNLPSDKKPSIIYTAHGFHFHRGGNVIRNLLFIALEKIAGLWTDFLVVINREDFVAAEKYRIVKKGRVVYMPGIGVDTQKYNKLVVDQIQLSRLREELKLTKESRVFLMIAGFDPGKRHGDILRAFAALQRLDVHLLLAGSGSLENAMKELAVTLGVSDNVHFLGFRSDIPTLITLSEGVILPSEREGLPRSLMEAMCLGKPCIGADIRGIRDLLGEGRGLLVKVGDLKGFQVAMEWILDHSDLAATMAEKGKRSMIDHDLHKVIQLHENLYEEALRGRHGGW